MERCKLCGEMVNYDDPAIHYGGHKCKESKPLHPDPSIQRAEEQIQEMEKLGIKHLVDEFNSRKKPYGGTEDRIAVLELSVKRSLYAAVKDELSRANILYPQFHSAHEAESVLREELEECTDEMDSLNQDFSELWQKIKTNNVDGQKRLTKSLRRTAELLHVELTQFRAMIEKLQFYYDSEDSK